MIEVLSAPDWTLAKLRELRDALQWAQAKFPDDAGAAIDRVATVDERTAGLLRRVLASKELLGVTAVLTVLLAAVAIMVTLYVSGADGITPADVQPIVEQQIAQLEQEFGEDAPPTPAPPAEPSSESPAAPTPPQ